MYSIEPGKLLFYIDVISNKFVWGILNSRQVTLKLNIESTGINTAGNPILFGAF